MDNTKDEKTESEKAKEEGTSFIGKCQIDEDLQGIDMRETYQAY